MDIIAPTGYFNHDVSAKTRDPITGIGTGIHIQENEYRIKAEVIVAGASGKRGAFDPEEHVNVFALANEFGFQDVEVRIVQLVCCAVKEGREFIPVCEVAVDADGMSRLG